MPSASYWKVTYDPGGALERVLVNFGQDIEGEILFPWSQAIQTGAGVRSLGSFNLARANVKGGFSFVTIERHASDKAAQEWCLDLCVDLCALAGINGKIVRAEIDGGTKYYDLASATINDSVPSVRQIGMGRTTTNWNIGGTVWTRHNY